LVPGSRRLGKLMTATGHWSRTGRAETDSKTKATSSSWTCICLPAVSREPADRVGVSADCGSHPHHDGQRRITVGGASCRARGYLVKGADRDEIIHAIRAGTSGQVIFGAGATAYASTFFTGASTSSYSARPFPKLTDRELQILQQWRHRPPILLAELTNCA
jgi:hypothetical protein